MASTPQQQPSPAPSPEPSKKYWWIASIAVPIIVALIGFIAQWKPGVITPPAPAASTPTPTSGTPVSQPTSVVLNPSGTIWEGYLTYKKGAQTPAKIFFAADGTALVYRGVLSLPYELIDHCTWKDIAGVITIACSYQTNVTGTTSMQFASSYNLNIKESVMTGVRDEPNDPDIRSVVKMKQLQ